MANMRKKLAGPIYQPVTISLYGASMSFSSAQDAQRVQEWVDADPLNDMRRRGRDVLDVRSFKYVQHPHPRGTSPTPV
jgi:hypothetical protein